MKLGQLWVGRERGKKKEGVGVMRWSLGREGRKMEEDEEWRGGGGGREGDIAGGPSMREMKRRMKRVWRKMGKEGREHSTGA